MFMIDTDLTRIGRVFGSEEYDSRHIMEPEGSLPYSQQPAINPPHPEPDRSSPHPPPHPTFFISL
jgi:hypothetical protein